MVGLSIQPVQFLGSTSVPLFLTFTKSAILDELGIPDGTRSQLCLLSFAIAAAIVSKRFVTQVAGHVITQLEELKRENEELKADAENIKTALTSHCGMALENSADLEGFEGIEKRLLTLFTLQRFVQLEGLLDTQREQFPAVETDKAIQHLKDIGIVGSIYLKERNQTYLYLKDERS
jgi:hypothetical protein